MKFMRRDVRDYEELAWFFNDECDAAAAASNFNDSASQRSSRSQRSQRSSYSNQASVMKSIQAVPNSMFYNVQRLLIQEKGEQTYYILAKHKRAKMLLEAEDHVFRNRKLLALTHQNLHGSSEANMLDAEAKWRKEEQLR